MDLPKAIQELQHSKNFAVFIGGIHQDREFWVSKLGGASADEVREISGRIAALDAIIGNVDAASLFKRHDMNPSLVLPHVAWWTKVFSLFKK